MDQDTKLWEYCMLYYKAGENDVTKRREAFKLLVDFFMNTIEHQCYLVFDFYGKKELSWEGIERDDIINAGIVGLADGLEEFHFDENKFSKKAFFSYMHIAIKHNIRIFIQSVNGVSQHYSMYLIRMKMNKLSFDMPDEQLMKELNVSAVTVQNMRKIFTGSTKQPLCEALNEADTDFDEKMLNQTISEQMHRLIKSTVSREDYEFFYDRFLRDTPLPKSACVKKYEISIGEVNKKESYLRLKLRDAFIAAGIMPASGEVNIKPTNKKYEALAMRLEEKSARRVNVPLIDDMEELEIL